MKSQRLSGAMEDCSIVRAGSRECSVAKGAVCPHHDASSACCGTQPPLYTLCVYWEGCALHSYTFGAKRLMQHLLHVADKRVKSCAQMSHQFSKIFIHFLNIPGATLVPPSRINLYRAKIP